MCYSTHSTLFQITDVMTNMCNYLNVGNMLSNSWRITEFTYKWLWSMELSSINFKLQLLFNMVLEPHDIVPLRGCFRNCLHSVRESFNNE